MATSSPNTDAHALLGLPADTPLGRPEADPVLLLDLVPILPEPLLWQAIGVMLHVYALDPQIRTRLLEALLSRLPTQGQKALLQEALSVYPQLSRYLSETLLQKALEAAHAIEDHI